MSIKDRLNFSPRRTEVYPIGDTRFVPSLSAEWIADDVCMSANTGILQNAKRNISKATSDNLKIKTINGLKSRKINARILWNTFASLPWVDQPTTLEDHTRYILDQLHTSNEGDTKNSVVTILATYRRKQFREFFGKKYKPDTEEDIRRMLDKNFIGSIQRYEAEMEKISPDSDAAKLLFDEGKTWLGTRIFGPSYLYCVFLKKFLKEALSKPKENRQESPSRRTAQNADANQTASPQISRPLRSRELTTISLPLEEELSNNNIAPTSDSQNRLVHFLAVPHVESQYVRAALIPNEGEAIAKEFGVDREGVEFLRRMYANLGGGIIPFYEQITSLWEDSLERNNTPQGGQRVVQFIQDMTGIAPSGEYAESVIGSYLIQFLRSAVALRIIFPRHRNSIKADADIPTIDDSVRESLLIDGNFQRMIGHSEEGKQCLQTAWTEALNILNEFQRYPLSTDLNTQWSFHYKNLIYNRRHTKRR